MFNMKIYVAIILTSLICITMQTKAQIHIQGKVVDENKNPLSYALIKIKNNQQIQNNVVCDSNGFFEIKQFKYAKNLQIQAAYLNDTSISYTIDSTNKNFVFTIGIKQLNEVVVKTQKPLIERKADRMIYNIGDKPLYQNMEISQLLISIPRVEVNPVTGGIGIRGKGSVKVMIEERIINFSGQDLLNYLSTYQSDIERIEVISNPPAQYDAAGGGGLINIILKKGKANKIETTLYTQGRQNKYFATNNGINVKYNKNNLLINTNLIAINGSGGIEVNNYTEFKDPISSNWKEISNHKWTYNTYNFSLDLQYQLSLKSTLNLSLAYTNNQEKTYIDQRLEYYKTTIDSLGLGQGIQNNIGINQSLGISYKKSFKKESNYLLFSMDWLSTKDSNNSNIDNQNYIAESNIITNVNSQISSLGNTNIKLWSGKIDLVLNELLKKINFKTGLKYNEFSNNSIIDYDLKFNQQSIFKNNQIITYNDFTYKEKIFAGYVSVDKEWEKFAFKMGLRYEQTNYEGKGANGLFFSNQYDNYFPSIFFQWKINDENNWDISYSKRINRPDLFDLNPYRRYFNQGYYWVGNPFLIPVLQENIEINGSIKDLIYIYLYYTFKNRPITYIHNTDTKNTLFQNTENIGNSESFGFDISFSKDISKTYKLDVGLSGSKYNFNQVPSSITNINNLNYMFAIFNTNSFKINKTFSIGINSNWLLPGSGGDGVLQSTQNGHFFTNISFQKKINKKININFSISDIFKLGQEAYIIETDKFYTYRLYYGGLQSVRLRLTYRFGKELKTVNRESAIGEEQNRLNKRN